ncbi:MAG TPA: PaaI family thioesterase [Dehalococcoidia bacterium]|jgi:acyl-coenzyme A thioesterase PaaI-like protein
MKLKFRQEDGRAVADFTPEQYLQGFPGYMHGGGVATVLDEAMGWAAYQVGLWAMTAKFTIRFRKPVPLRQQVRASGWVTRDRGRFLEVRAELRSRQGHLLAEADGVFVRLDGERAEAVRQQYEAAKSD